MLNLKNYNEKKRKKLDKFFFFFFRNFNITRLKITLLCTIFNWTDQLSHGQELKKNKRKERTSFTSLL